MAEPERSSEEPHWILRDLRDSRVWKDAYQEGYEKGRMEGLKEGLREGFKEKMIIRCLAKEMSAEYISKLMNVSLPEVERMAEDSK